MKTFSEAFTDKFHSKGYTLRTFRQKLEKLGCTTTASKISKIMRGIQNPKDQAEFKAIMDALDVTDPQEVKDLETLAMNFIPPKPLTDEEFLKTLPIFLHHDFKDEAELNEFIKKWRKIMDEDHEPDLK